MPWNIDIIPLDHSDSRKKSNNGSYECDCRLIDAMPILCHPKNEHADENCDGLELIAGHLTHRVELVTKTGHATLKLRDLFLFLHREDEFDTHEPSNKEKDHCQREAGNKPVRIAEGLVSICSGSSDHERDSQKIGSRTGHERTRTDVHLEEVLEYEVTTEIVSLALACTKDGSNDHEYRQEDCGLYCCRRNEDRKDHIDYQEAEEDS